MINFQIFKLTTHALRQCKNCHEKINQCAQNAFLYDYIKSFFYYKLSNLKGKLNNSYTIGFEEGWQKGDFILSILDLDHCVDM